MSTTKTIRWSTVGWVLASAAFAAPPSRAEAAPQRAAVRLEYRRSPGAEVCPGEGVLRREIAAQLGYDPVSQDAADQLTTTIFRGPDREMHGSMELKDARGAVTWSRHLFTRNEDCKELVLSMALSLRIALDPSFRAQGSPSAPAEAKAAPTCPAPPPPPAPPAEEARWPELRVGLGAAVSFGTLPSASAGPSLDVSLRGRALSLGLGARVELPNHVDADGGGSVATWLAAGTLAPCSHFRYFFACGVASLGAINVAGSGAQIANPGTYLWAAAGPRAGIELPLSERFRLRVHGDLAIRLSRKTIHIIEPQRSWTSPPVEGLLGAELVFAIVKPRALTPRGASEAPLPLSP